MFKTLSNVLKLSQTSCKYLNYNVHYVSSAVGIRYYSNIEEMKEKIRNGPSLQDFINEAAIENQSNTEADQDFIGVADPIPYLNQNSLSGEGKTVYIETYGCQMNVSDTEIVLAILKNEGYAQTSEIKEADVVLVNTCSIRDHAEEKIWHRLGYLKNLKLQNRIEYKGRKPAVGVLGCMAERLKTKLIEADKLVDIVAGPDAYRDLPRLLSQILDEGAKNAVNVQLSQDETYADISPVRTVGHQAFVSIMRGCNNMCTYCIVPFTRGRERSRDPKSILREIKELSDQGVKEVTLLGQNVNSYNYIEENATKESLEPVSYVEGFNTIYKTPLGGVRFHHLLEQVAEVDPEIRIRFTSPHPKDFPMEVLELIKIKPNICNSLHIPAQSGNSANLDRMGRGYSREAYLTLIENIKKTLPNYAISSDFIAGFCGETEEEHKDTISLLESVQYDQAFMFAYSLREKTKAHRSLSDDVPKEIKSRRLTEIIDTFQKNVQKKMSKELNKTHLVLVEQISPKFEGNWIGRNDLNHKVIFPTQELLDQSENMFESSLKREIKPGDYVAVSIKELKGRTLIGKPIAITTLKNFTNPEYLNQISQ